MAMCRVALLAILAAILLVAGCGGPPWAKVSGTVTLDDKPLTSGTVTFTRVDGSGALATGAIDSQGRYQLVTGTDAGLAPGSYVATVIAAEMVPAKSPTDEPVSRPITPLKYADAAKSDLKFEVQPGSSDIPLRLLSK